MKKLIAIVAVAMVAMTASADKLYNQSRFFDNWAIGIEGGAVAPTTHHRVIADTRGTFGLNLTKMISPVFGLQFEGEAYVNTYCSTNAMRHNPNIIDATNVSLNGIINFSNFFAGYKGQPRLFEVEGVIGAGWGHTFASHYYTTITTVALPDGSTTGGVTKGNYMTGKFGLNLNFNVGEKKAWTIGVKPAIVYCLTDAVENKTLEGYNINRSNLELLAGVTYHFKNSNGTHHFTFGRAYDQAEVDGLNAQINALRGTVADKDAQIAADQKTIKDLQDALNDCRNQKPIIKTVTETVTETKTNNIPDVLVTFRQGKSNVDASQLPNVERVATYLNSHKDAKVVIKGYASPEGNADLNAKLAAARAEAVKTILTNKYRIAANRIEAEGQGVGDMFSEPDWNRVSICTIGE